jgi:hypothetical protein
MQLLDVIFEMARQVSLHGIVYVGYIRYHRADTGLFYTLICPGSHPPRQEHLAIGDAAGHQLVSALGGRVKAMTTPVGTVGFFSVWLACKLGMPHLIASLTRNNFPVFNGNNYIERGTTKVLANGYAVF